MHKGILTAILCTGLIGSGCTQLKQQQEGLDAVQSDIQSLRVSLDLTKNQVAGLEELRSADTASVNENLDGISTALTELRKTVGKRCGQRTVSSTQCEKQPRTVIMSQDNKMVLGAVEKVWLDPPGIDMEARIDTGASSSSLHAEKITRFERDGDNWVRFQISNNRQVVSVERPVVKFVRVYQQADKSGSRRPVVALRLFLGDVKATFEFTLADRSHLEHDMILGRNFLTDMALVDVSKQFIQPRYTPVEQ